ncbi:hypothetical protein AXG93_2062s1160 [Marchantia polymorpha subsp. ruderalis]|uniref:Uncharacterized protein n=1 Tax=Marchantia polymorpha subsp. ruderalis TaxID=1480154 RepID=A0A176VGR4_MARPO|nr:hypothetical protein AXG93_2062s1160 [Marchantia polymorpha subsp. ruderalis]
MELKHHKRVQQCRTPKDLLLVVVKEETCCKKSWETQPSENASRSKRTETMKPFPTKKEMGKGSWVSTRNRKEVPTRPQDYASKYLTLQSSELASHQKRMSPSSTASFVNLDSPVALGASEYPFSSPSRSTIMRIMRNQQENEDVEDHRLDDQPFQQQQ